MGIIATTIKAKLTSRFNPTQLEVIDESHQHAHHAGAKAHIDAGGAAESHFHVVISAEEFTGLSRLSAHRAVMDTLSEELAGPVHALRLTVKR
ncbi:BolA family protein [Robiginitomaculum antarcticum]|uniref:BolA family protein n=1 Tax=Robiginitomaculum antarcticum TaxID=437507 RepID=UPI000363DE83|nr:BolA family protein [Robiginitomaculum antarcticum]